MDMDLAEKSCATASATRGQLSRHEINLLHVRLSPYADVVERETIAWMQTSALLPDERYLEKVTRMAVWGYAGFSHPFGRIEELTLYSKYITLWLLWDDLVVEKATDLGAILDGLADAFRWDRASLTESNPYLRAWRDIVDGYKQLGASRDFVARLRWKMACWVKTAASENRSVYATSAVSPWSHLRKRLITIGVIPTAQLLDLQVGDVDRIPAARRVVLTASAIVAIVNELVSVEKDRDRVNLVALIQKQDQCDFDSAYARVVDMYCLSLAKLSALLNALPAELKEWGLLISHMAQGFSYWHFVCPRYDPQRIICRIPT
jgi:hypothetical protein